MDSEKMMHSLIYRLKKLVTKTRAALIEDDD